MMSDNYFNTLSLREQLEQLGRCGFMQSSEFEGGVSYLKGKKIVIIGCGAQGFAQGLNLRDSGLDVCYALRESAIADKRQSWKNAVENGFTADVYNELIPNAFQLRVPKIRHIIAPTAGKSRGCEANRECGGYR